MSYVFAKFPKGFSLLELLIAIALFGAITAFLLVAVNPFEQIKKGTDTVRRTVANDVYSAVNNLSIKSGNYPWKSDISGVTLSSADGKQAIAALIASGELSSAFTKVSPNDLAKIALTATADGSALRLCFLPESKTMKNDTATSYDRYGNQVTTCPPEGCYHCLVNNAVAMVVGVPAGDGGTGEPVGSVTPPSSPTPTPMPVIPTTVPTVTPSPSPAPTPTAIPTPTATPLPAGAPITKKVYLAVYNPQLSAAFGANQNHINFYGSNDPYALTNEAIAWFKSITNGRVNYVLAKQTLLNKYPTLTDGFTYTDVTYHSMITGDTPVHEPVWANYNTILTETAACEAFNAGEIDELWLFGGSWFGFYESRLAGTNAFWYNSPVVTGTSCTKPLPIMGYNYERGLPEMIHDFGHRAEYTMLKVYTSWARSRIYTNFDRFALVQAKAPSFAFSGCGTTHFPPNAPVDYDYSNMAAKLTMCDDFLNYPELMPVASIQAEITDCRTWNCTDIGFFGYWFSRFPQFAGTAPDGKLNDWWDYLLNPSKAL